MAEAKNCLLSLPSLASMILMLTAVHVRAQDCQESRVDTFMPEQDLLSGITTLKVVVEAEGNINWISSGASALALTVTRTGDPQSDLNFEAISVQFMEEASSNSIYLIIRCRVDNTGEQVNVVKNCNKKARLSSCTGRADTEIRIQSGFQFGSVELTARSGSIQVDEELTDSNATLTCLSGTDDSAVCGECCNGNGVCMNGRCVCTNGFEESDNCRNVVNTTFSLHDNPADPVIISLTTPEGEELTVLGNKNDDGVATSLDALVYVDEFGNESTTTLNPNNSLPETVLGLDGTRVIFVWSDDLMSVQVTAVSADGEIQATVNVDLLGDSGTTNSISGILSGPTQARRTGGSIDRRRRAIERQLRNMDKSARTKRNLDLEIHERKKRAVGTFVTAQINVQSCNTAETNAQVFATIRQNYVETPNSVTFSSEETLNSFSTGTPGQFEVRVPTLCELSTSNSTLEEGVEDLCMDITDTLQLGCVDIAQVPQSSDNMVCQEIANAIDAFTDPLPGISVPAFGVCSFGLQALRLHCRFWGNSAQTGGLDTASLICERIERAVDPFLTLVEPTNIFIQPFAIFPEGNLVQLPGEVFTLKPGASGPLSQPFTIANNNVAPAVILLTVNPPDPAPFQDYVATVQLRCTTPTTTILMETVGSDGFEASTSCLGVVTQCVLNVLGAEALVRDVVTVSVNDSSQGAGNQIVRNVAIVF